MMEMVGSCLRTGSYVDGYLADRNLAIVKLAKPSGNGRNLEERRGKHDNMVGKSNKRAHAFEHCLWKLSTTIGTGLDYLQYLRPPAPIKVQCSANFVSREMKYV